MTNLDLFVIVLGLFAGYWLVSKLLSKGSSSSKKADDQGSGGREMSGIVWCEVLQVAPTASVEEIKDAYRRLISQYHPDKVENLGPEIKEVAARKAQEITVAYKQGMKARGATS